MTKVGRADNVEYGPPPSLWDPSRTQSSLERETMEDSSLAAHAVYLLHLQPRVSIPGCLHLRSWAQAFPRGVCRGSLFRRRSRKPDGVLFTLTQHPGLSLSFSHPGVLPEPLVRDLLSSLNTPSVCVDPPAPRRCATARKNERIGYVSSTLSPAGAP